MKKILFYIALLTSATFVFAQTVQKPTVAIYSVKPIPSLAQKLKSDGNSQTIGRVIESMDSQLADAITQTRKMTVLARSDWNSIVREQDFGQSGNVDSATAAKVGNASGAKYVLETTVTDFQDYIETATFAAIGKTAQKRILRFGAVAKLYDATTGALIDSVNETITNEDVADLPSYSIRNGNLNDALIPDISKLMAQKVAARISDVAFPARVLSVIGNQIIINRGDGTGIAVNDVYTVMAMGEKMIDPDTGEDLGSAEANVGIAVVTEVTPKFSKAILKENFGVEKGNIARKNTKPSSAKYLRDTEIKQSL